MPTGPMGATPPRSCRAIAVVLLVVAVGVAVPVHAQTEAEPLVTDPTGDQQASNGQLVAQPPPWDNVDVLSISALQPSPGLLVLALTTKAAATATENVTLNLTVARGPSSLPNSTTAGIGYSMLYHNGVLSGLPGASASAAGAVLSFSIPLSAIGAVGGDVVTDVRVEAEDFSPGAAPFPVTQDDSSAADSAPDSGTSVPFTLERPPVAGGVTLAVASTSIQADPLAPLSAVPPTAEATVRTGNATVEFGIRVGNTALDADTVTLAAAPTAGARVSLSPSTLDLAAGGSGTATLRIAFDSPDNGTATFVVDATSLHGGKARLTLLVHVEVPGPPPAERTPVPAALGFLTPLVTSVGLDDLFGDYAELVFLLFLVLVVVVAVYLLLFLVQTPWVRIRVSPRRAVVAPGGVAEFHVELEGGKKHPALARATLRTAGAWIAGLQVGRSAARPGESLDIPLESGKEALPQEAILRVQVPYDAPGGTVRTTATIHNDGPVVAKLRVVLQKDGSSVAEERVDVPPHDVRTVVLAWTAGAGRNLVKVQIFLA
ncbi:MAG: hypothetical protein LC620_03505 [Halobacteriales archaeon]|nr:hypothetical protein [Halobacteriales archaeon]